jgi:hypothetical protein
MIPAGKNPIGSDGKKIFPPRYLVARLVRRKSVHISFRDLYQGTASAVPKSIISPGFSP